MFIGRLFSLCAIWLLASVALAANSRMTIHWVDVLLPPFHHIDSGPYKDKGFTDQIIILLKQHLTDFDHRVSHVPVERFMSLIKSEKFICNPGMKKTPDRENFLRFSQASIFVPSIGVAFKGIRHRILLRNDPQVRANKISLKKLIELDAKFGTESSRSYGETIDSLLKPLMNSSRVTKSVKMESSRTLFTMLKAGRFDYWLSYSFEASFQAKQSSAVNDINWLPIAEEQGFVTSHVACSKTPESEPLIKRIDEALSALKPKAEYRKIFEYWLDENLIPQYQEAYRKQFLLK